MLRNPHLQTMLNSQGPRELRARLIGRRLATESVVLQAADGTRLLAELDHGPHASAKLVVVLHGWEGSSRSPYMILTAKRLLDEGFDVLRINLRDHGDSHHLNRELFNSTRSPEVASALQGFIDRHEYQRVLICGYSLGGSFALRIAADSGLELGLDGAVAVCPPVEPKSAMRALNSGFFVYERYFFNRWHRSLRRKLECFPELGYGADLARARTVDDLNRLFVPRHTRYATVDEYFAAYAVTGDRLARLGVPTAIVAAEDDPIIPAEDFARIDPHELLEIDLQRFGGHCGFIKNLAVRSWVEDRLIELLHRYSR